MTEKKVAANRRNQALTHGALTAEGRERIRAAHLRHGFYAKAEVIALRSLGEDPDQFQALLEGLWKEFGPAGSLQEGLVIRLARAMWLMNRADRTQEGIVLRMANESGVGRENRLHAQMMRLKMTAESLRSLARSVAAPHYVTTKEDLDVIKKLHDERVIKEMGEIALALFFQLLAPDAEEDGEDSEEKTRRVFTNIRAIFGLGPVDDDGSPISPETEQTVAHLENSTDEACPASEEEDSGVDARYPTITPADWKARERARKLLKNILNRQAECCEVQRQTILRESLAGPSHYERAAEIAPLQANSALLRRIEDSYFREVRRITNLLMKVKRQESRLEGAENSELCHDISEIKGVSSFDSDLSKNLNH